MARELAETLVTEKNKLSGDGPWLLLWQIDTDAAATNTFCLVAHDEPVEFDGVTYSPFPLSVSARTETSDGSLTNWGISVANSTRALMSYIEANDGFIGNAVRVTLVHKDHLDDPTAKLEDSYKVTACRVDAGTVSLSLGHTNFLALPFGSGRFTYRCRWKFKSFECRYTGAATSCDKTLDGANGCIAKSADSNLHPRRYGGFPTMLQK